VAQSKALQFLQKRTLNIIFSGVEYAATLIIANIEALYFSYNDRNSHSFSSDGHEVGRGSMVMARCPLPSGSATELGPAFEIARDR